MKVIKDWRKATEELAMIFVKKYFPSERDGRYYFWVGDEIGSVFCVSDMFFDVNRMIEALENKATYQQISDYADIELEHALKSLGIPTPINFKNYVKYGWINKNEDNVK